MNPSPGDDATTTTTSSDAGLGDTSPASAAASGVPTGTGDEAAAEAARNAIAALREQIDAVDLDLIALAQRRIDLSKEIQGLRVAHGGPGRVHSRELKIVNTYVEGLGRGGSQLAHTLLELSRGRA